MLAYCLYVPERFTFGVRSESFARPYCFPVDGHAVPNSVGPVA